jgi:hypothetical protein
MTTNAVVASPVAAAIIVTHDPVRRAIGRRRPV